MINSMAEAAVADCCSWFLIWLAGRRYISLLSREIFAATIFNEFIGIVETGNFFIETAGLSFAGKKNKENR